MSDIKINIYCNISYTEIPLLNTDQDYYSEAKYPSVINTFLRASSICSAEYGSSCGLWIGIEVSVAVSWRPELDDNVWDVPHRDFL